MSRRLSLYSGLSLCHGGSWVVYNMNKCANKEISCPMNN